eukprot:GHVU01016210.1.p3 GENE.GHVU01016210.1~~GHVU01016210.1.p3  ORF type:complete len:117 (-),score=8.88 GHVU01016210.1:139-489(-)
MRRFTRACALIPVRRLGAVAACPSLPVDHAPTSPSTTTHVRTHNESHAYTHTHTHTRVRGRDEEEALYELHPCMIDEQQVNEGMSESMNLPACTCACVRACACVNVYPYVHECVCP